MWGLGFWLRLLSTLGRGFYLLVFIWVRGGGGDCLDCLLFFLPIGMLESGLRKGSMGIKYNVPEAESRCCILRSTSVDSPTRAFGC